VCHGVRKTIDLSGGIRTHTWAPQGRFQKPDYFDEGILNPAQEIQLPNKMDNAVNARKSGKRAKPTER